MNKRITIKLNNNKFHFQNDFVWREGFKLYLTIDEINGEKKTLANDSISLKEYEDYGEQYKIAVEKYKKLKVFM